MSRARLLAMIRSLLLGLFSIAPLMAEPLAGVPAAKIPVAAVIPPLPSELASYVLDPAPTTAALLLKKNDRLALCGDSITEQKRYSVLLETYLTACLPELQITCRQYGWSGEKAENFLKRLASDVLRFKPTIATTCYGMNDFKYVPYQDAIAADYRNNQTAVLRAFKQTGCRVVLGSPGIIDSVPAWVKTATGTVEDLNHALCRFRNINIDIASSEQTAFADVYRPMLLANHQAKKQYGADFKVAGKDGVHPDWAGQLIMTYAFLKAMGVDGDLGTIVYDASLGKASAVNGHAVIACADGAIKLRSTRLPFCAGPGAIDQDNSVRAGLALVPFDDELNRFILRITAPTVKAYDISWGNQRKRFSASQLKAGVNLAKEFDDNPLLPAFNQIREAVVKKQTYETRQIKELAHGPEGAADADATFALTEKARAPLENAVQTALRPVEHTITIATARD